MLQVVMKDWAMMKLGLMAGVVSKGVVSARVGAEIRKMRAGQGGLGKEGQAVQMRELALAAVLGSSSLRLVEVLPHAGKRQAAFQVLVQGLWLRLRVQICKWFQLRQVLPQVRPQVLSQVLCPTMSQMVIQELPQMQFLARSQQLSQALCQVLHQVLTQEVTQLLSQALPQMLTQVLSWEVSWPLTQVLPQVLI